LYRYKNPFAFRLLSIVLISILLLIHLTNYIGIEDESRPEFAILNKAKTTLSQDSEKYQNTESIIPPVTHQTRSSRYLENIINLGDLSVQLTVISGNADDNARSDGNYQSGGSLIASGDIDNDGYQDLLLGSPYADGNDETRETAGQIMVVFGRDQTPPGTIFDQAVKNPKEIGLVIHGADGTSVFGQNQGDSLGYSIACGDIDGDGFDDIVMGAPYGDSRNNQRWNAGEVYVIYGASRTELGTEINLESMVADLTIWGAYGDFPNSPDLTGYSVAVGNVVGDNKQDIIIGAPGANPSETDAGIVWVISGKSRVTQGSEIDLQAGADLRINGVTASSYTGFCVGTGDINGDEREDILIGAPAAEKNGFRPSAGITYVVYGKQSFSSSVNLRGGSDVNIYGANSNDNSGYSLTVGNLNGDSFNDIMIGIPGGDGPNNNQDNTGEVAIIYGSATLSSDYDINNNDQNVIIYGESSLDTFGYSISAGNVNDDIYDDLLIGARNGDGQYNSKSNSGDSYLMLGNSTSNLGNVINALGDSDSKFYGVNNDDHSGRSVLLADLDADGFDDIIIASPLANGPNEGRNNAGEFYIVYSLPPPVKNVQIELVDGDIDGETVLARYKPYSFRVNITNTLGYKDCKFITLTLDPLGYSIAYRWLRTNNQFIKINDPSGLVECVSTESDTKHDSNYNYSVDFKLIFNWTFNKTYPIDCKISSVGVRSFLDEDIYPDIFSVNNKLNLIGNLKVSGSIQGKVKDNSWVKGDEQLTFSGITVVYQDTNDHYPPNTEYSLGIQDNTNLTF
jgi:hypothetical protein